MFDGFDEASRHRHPEQSLSGLKTTLHAVLSTHWEARADMSLSIHQIRFE